MMFHVILCQQYWRNTHGALVIYDITSQQSLAEALEWKKYLDKVIIQQDGKCIPAVLIGNKVSQFLLYVE